MKTYKQITEDIGLSTGAGIAMYDPLMGGNQSPVKRRNILDALGICEDCMLPMSMKEGKLTCPSCKKTAKETF